MRIYVVDLSINQNVFERFKNLMEGRGELVCVPGFEPPYPALETKDALVLTGSEYSILDEFEWLPALMGLFRTCFDAGNPVLGVCFGHQLIARSLLGLSGVGRAERPEMTYVPIEILRDHPIFSGLPNPFFSLSSHYDEVVKVPPGFEVMARSERCAIQVLRHIEKNVVGIQFHPEFDPEYAKRCIAAEEKKLQTYGLSVEELLSQVPDESTGAERVLENFLDALA